MANLKKPKKQLNKYIKFSSIAFQMGLTILAGVYFGQWLDEKFNNENKLYTVIFSLVSVFASLYNVIKQIITISKQDEE